MNDAATNIERQWQQARALLAAGKIGEAMPYLELAAAGSHPAANFNLGCVHLFGLADNSDKTRGLPLIRLAAELGHGAAFYQLAMLELSKPIKQPDWQYANECLKKSAERGYPTAMRSLALLWSDSTDASVLSVGTLCLEYAAQAGDLVSLALLMHRLYDGIGCRKNPLRASAINTLLMTSGLPVEPPGSPANPALAPPASLADFPVLPEVCLQDGAKTPTPHILSESPWIAVAEQVINSEESRLVRYLGGPHLQPSVTATPDGQRMQVQLRTSFDMVFDDMLEDLTLLLIQRRMAAFVDTTPAHSEPLQLLRYQKGQEYRPHRDYLPPSFYTPLEQGGAGQRESTVIVYLNDVVDGGETEFIEIGKKIAPKTGRVLAFRNLHDDRTPDPRTLHAGLPVTAGSKWIATLWIHQGVYRS